MKNTKIRSGVYALYKGSELVYIGSTEDITDRFKSHVDSDKDFDSMQFIMTKDFKNLEAHLIDKYRPKLNSVMPGHYSTSEMGFPIFPLANTISDFANYLQNDNEYTVIDCADKLIMYWDDNDKKVEKFQNYFCKQYQTYLNDKVIAVAYRLSRAIERNAELGYLGFYRICDETRHLSNWVIKPSLFDNNISQIFHAVFFGEYYQLENVNGKFSLKETNILAEKVKKNKNFVDMWEKEVDFVFDDWDFCQSNRETCGYIPSEVANA